ncbi:MAG: hypothetical protein QXT58_01905 [Archaeoglobaceae archaeon]
MERIAFVMGFLVAFVGMYLVFKSDLRLKAQEVAEARELLKRVKGALTSAAFYLSAGDVQRALEILDNAIKRIEGGRA